MDIKQLKINNIPYNIKDEVAREGVGHINEILPQKANTDGWYPRMVSGAAESLIGKDISVDEATGYVVPGATGIAKVNEVMGRSEKWNQVWQQGAGFGGNACSIVYDVATDSYTITHPAGRSFFTAYNYYQDFIAGHKYFVWANVQNEGLTRYVFYVAFTAGASIPASTQQAAQIISVPADKTESDCKKFVIYGFCPSDVAASMSVANLHIHDLTDIYGQGNEPTTVEQFAADVFAKYGKTLDEYFAYDAGSINNANVEKLDITGFNLLNMAGRTEVNRVSTPTSKKEFSENQYWNGFAYNGYSGNNYQTDVVVKDNFLSATPTNSAYGIGFPVKALPNTQYYCKSKYGAVGFFDKDGINIGYYVYPRGTFTTPSNCVWIVIVLGRTTTSYVEENVVLNISDATKNGTYEPYKHTELPINIKTITGKVNGEGESVTIFPNGMRGVGTAYDSLIVDEDGWARRAIVRTASVDMGSLNWLNATYNNQNCFRSADITNAKRHSGSTLQNSLCSTYKQLPAFTNAFLIEDENKVYFLNSDAHANNNIAVKDSSYSDVASFKAAMQGVPLIYEPATPIEYVLDTPILMTFNAYNGGVIRQIKGDMELATRLNITFALNVQGFINNANKAFVSAASMQAFLTKLSSAKGGTWGMTYNATTQQYEFTYNQ